MAKKLWTKGQSGNPAGRPKGAVSELKKLSRDDALVVINAITSVAARDPEGLTKYLSKVWATGKAAYLVKFLFPLLSYFLPKQAELSGELDISLLDKYRNMDPDDRRKKIKELEQKLRQSEKHK